MIPETGSAPPLGVCARFCVAGARAGLAGGDGVTRWCAAELQQFRKCDFARNDGDYFLRVFLREW